MLEIVLAAVILTAPKDTPVDVTLIEVLRPTIIALALDQEIIDPREKGYLLTQDDIEMLRGRREDMLDCPTMDECYRFPGLKSINALLVMNRLFRNNLSERLKIDCFHELEIKDAIIETDQLYHVWGTVRDAQCDYYYVIVRRQSLRTLRDLIGAEAFYSGRLPPPIPIWHLPKCS